MEVITRKAIRMAMLFTVGLMGMAALSGAWAQSGATVPTPPQVPPPSTLAPPLVPPTTPNTVLPEPATPPRELGKPEDDVRLDVAGYAIEGEAPPQLRDKLAALTARYTGAQRSFEDLSAAAAEVTRFLQRDLGYYLGYAYLPEQTPQPGANGSVIRIAVLEGRLDRVVLQWRDGLPVNRDIVEAYLARLQPGSVLKVRDLERVVFLVNDLRGMTARFEVRAGSQPGTATLVVTPSPENVYAGKVEFDANGTKALGPYRLSGLVQMNSPFGRGDGFTANALVSNTAGLAFALLGYNTPLGSDGFKLGSSLSLVRYALDKEMFPLELQGNAATLNVYGLYPLVRSRNLNLFTLASLEHKQYEDRNISARTRKSVDTLVLGTTGDFRDSVLGGGVNTYEASVITGQVRFREGAAPLDDDERFTKLTYGYTRLQDLITGRALVYFSVRGQYVASNLDTTEQFRVGGPEGVRAFAAGEGTGDLGVVSSLELRLLPPEAWFGRRAREMVFSLFADGGYVQYRYRKQQTAVLNETTNHAAFGGVGVGLSWVMPEGYSLRLSLAKPVSGTARTDDRSVRAFLQAAMLFN